MRNPRLITIGIVTLSVATFQPVAAQMSVKSDGAGDESLSRALEFEQRAVELHADVSRAAESARLHRWSAELRTASDPEAVTSLAMAAHLFGYAGKSNEARKTMEQAAQRALAMGDVIHAAQAYLDAAFFADQEKHRADVDRLGRKALLLAGSPLLSDDQRRAIVDRIRSNASLASLL